MCVPMSHPAADPLPLPSATARPRPPAKRRRLPRCDCGQPAITVIRVRVGCDPQYTVRLPLCATCLELERELHADEGD